MKPHHIKHLLDLLSISVAVGTLVSLLPSLAALLTIVWTGLRIYDWVESRWKNRPPVQD